MVSDDISSTNVEADVTGMYRDVQDRLERCAAGGGQAGVVGIRPHDAASLVDEIRGDERREEHALRTDEGPDGDLLVVQPRRCRRVPVRVVMRAVGGCGV
jgi:hypothetical protein